jgi:hypothetical protein
MLISIGIRDKGFILIPVGAWPSASHNWTGTLRRDCNIDALLWRVNSDGGNSVWRLPTGTRPVTLYSTLCTQGGGGAQLRRFVFTFRFISVRLTNGKASALRRHWFEINDGLLCCADNSGSRTAWQIGQWTFKFLGKGGLSRNPLCLRRGRFDLQSTNDVIPESWCLWSEDR